MGGYLLDQPIMVEMVEGHHNTLPTSRVFRSRSQSLGHTIHSRVKLWIFLAGRNATAVYTSC